MYTFVIVSTKIRDETDYVEKHDDRYIEREQSSVLQEEGKEQ